MEKMLVNIPKHQLAAAVLFAAEKSDPRTYLRGVCVEIANGAVNLVATNGHVMGVMRAAAEFEKEGPCSIDILIPAEYIKKLTKRGEYCVTLSVFDDEKCKLSADGVTFTFKNELASNGFVDWRRVIPSNVSLEPANYNADYLATIQDAFRKFYDNKMIYPVVMPNGRGGAIVYPSIENDDMFAVLMPVRANENKPATPPVWIKRP